MKKSLFEKVYGVKLKDLGSVKEVDACIEKKIGRKLEVKSSMLPIENISVDEAIDKALRKI